MFDQVGLQQAAAPSTTTTVQLANDITIADNPIAKSGGVPITITSKDGGQYSLSGGWSGGDATDGSQILALSDGASLIVDGVDIKNGRATNGGCVTATGTDTTVEFKNVNFESCKVSELSEVVAPSSIPVPGTSPVRLPSFSRTSSLGRSDPQADTNGGALYLAGGATASLDSSSVTMATNIASDGEDIFVTSATLTCQTTCVANHVPSTPCTNALLPAGAAACPLDCGACSTCPADTASTVVGSVAASDCVDANCGEYEYVGVDGTWYVLPPRNVV